jgi:hypothetical protein
MELVHGPWTDSTTWVYGSTNPLKRLDHCGSSNSWSRAQILGSEELFSILISIIEYQMDDQDLIWRNVFLRSNLSHLCCNGRSGWVTGGWWHRTLPTVAPLPPLTGGALACATVAKLQWGWVLRHRNDKLRPFVLTLACGERQRKLATVTWLGQGSLSVRVDSSGSPATLKAPTSAVVLGEALGAVASARAEVYWGGGDLWRRKGFGEIFFKTRALEAPFYRGFHTNLVPTLGSMSCTRWIWKTVLFLSDFVEILVGEKFLHIALLLTPEEDGAGHGLLTGLRPGHWATWQAGETRKMERSGPRARKRTGQTNVPRVGESWAFAQTD